jgi:hypothetical protein
VANGGMSKDTGKHFSETPVAIYKTTRQHNPEQLQRLENLKFHSEITCLIYVLTFCVRFQVLTAASMMFRIVFWDVQKTVLNVFTFYSFIHFPVVPSWNIGPLSEFL